MKRTTHDARRTTKLILALDVDTHKQAMRLVNLLRPQIKIFKVGLQLYTACGPRIIQDIRKAGAGVFLDLKFNDIPNTMVNAAREALKYKVAMFTLHTLAGPVALKEVAHTCRRSKTKILGVTLLTSISPRFLKDLGIARTLSGEVLYLARMAKRCGLDGVVCSVQEAKMIRKHLGKNFIILTPGIRLAGIPKGDQKRAATPQEASRVGSNYLVVGRPILESADPVSTVKGLLKR